LKSGDASVLYAFAERIIADRAATPCFVGKDARGRRLATGRRAAPEADIRRFI
jgi:inorganic triphosphatase YgiF